MSLELPTIEIPKNVLDRDYRGAGRAWAAVKDGKVIALRYMGEAPRPTGLPAWLEAAANNAEGLDERFLPLAWSSHGLSRFAAALQSCADCPKPPRRERYRPSELLTMARAALAAYDEAAFQSYRENCRAELGAFGAVVGGMCSCTVFVPSR